MRFACLLLLVAVFVVCVVVVVVVVFVCVFVVLFVVLCFSLSCFGWLVAPRRSPLFVLRVFFLCCRVCCCCWLLFAGCVYVCLKLKFCATLTVAHSRGRYWHLVAYYQLSQSAFALFRGRAS